MFILSGSTARFVTWRDRAATQNPSRREYRRGAAVPPPRPAPPRPRHDVIASDFGFRGISAANTLRNFRDHGLGRGGAGRAVRAVRRGDAPGASRSGKYSASLLSRSRVPYVILY